MKDGPPVRSGDVARRKRGTTPAIRHELRQHAAIEPVIGHMKIDGHLGRNFLLGVTGMPSTPSSQASATTSVASIESRSPGRRLGRPNIA
jgi:hypothetical protein